MSDVYTEETINDLSWNDVRSLCKEHGILVKGKKPALVAKLIQLLVHKTDLSASDMKGNETGRSTSRMTNELDSNNEMSGEILTDEKHVEEPMKTDSKHDELNLSSSSDSTLEETEELPSQIEESYDKETTLPIDESIQLPNPSTAAEKMDIPELNDDELETVKENSTDDDSLLPANETFTIEDELSTTYVISDHEDKVTTPIEENIEHQSRPTSALSHPEEDGNQNFKESLPQMEMARSGEDGMQMDFKCSLIKNVGTSSVPQFPSKLPQLKMGYSEIMAKEHAKHFARMDSIADYQQKKDERIQRAQRAQSESSKRLHSGLPSSPSLKSPSRDVSGFNNNMDVSMSPIPFRSVNNTPRAAPIVRRPKEDVKALTRRMAQSTRAKSVIPATIPVNSVRMDQLATPKHAAQSPIAPERRAFTPKTGRYVYTDTTKMSDIEFQMYQRRERLQQAQQAKRPSSPI